MRCSEAKRLFDPYLDGELSAPLRAELDAHRLECADCRREAAKSLGALLAMEARESLIAALSGQFRHRPQVPCL